MVLPMYIAGHNASVINKIFYNPTYELTSEELQACTTRDKFKELLYTKMGDIIESDNIDNASYKVSTYPSFVYNGPLFTTKMIRRPSKITMQWTYHNPGAKISHGTSFIVKGNISGEQTLAYTSGSSGAYLISGWCNGETLIYTTSYGAYNMNCNIPFPNNYITAEDTDISFYFRFYTADFNEFTTLNYFKLEY